MLDEEETTDTFGKVAKEKTRLKSKSQGQNIRNYSLIK